ncbi:MAG: bifunctional (p)ppGpp synthetase/guanosine-3',5'-bis(diphosphate) 3'-pyrophosphohydrolase [Rhodospirillaceae bacterium]|jgi:guanosine-3',5'-bis(diphosphate) 3'-pyrophosphohydrolase
MLRQFELVNRVRSYDADANEDALNKAYVFSMMAHGSQKRASGDPYFSHPVEVAGILSDLKLDSDTIVTGLLHDTVEDTVATIDEIEGLFGKSIAALVDGVTKLSKLELQSDDKRQIENFRKLLLASSRDIRVLLVKLADRLHNMRTLKYIKSPEKRSEIARETLEIFAPLAERIGMHELKDNLEDLAFSELNGDARSTIVARLNFLREEAAERDLVTSIGDRLKEVLTGEGVNCLVSGREKTPYSIWRKMEQKNIEFGRLSDVMAFRIIVGSLEDCYRGLGAVHAAYRCIPGRFKDYISTPKRNGYQSIHTGVMGPLNHRIEIQFRTQEMHEVAEFGVAAHWQYKQGLSGAETVEYGWVKELLEILDDAADQEDFFERTRLDLYNDRVFCFTPKGELIALPRGATPVDFAYEVHSEIGDRCISCKINGSMVPLRTKLRNGDQVEVITSDSGTPDPAWEHHVVTGKARSRINRFVKMQRRKECIALGQAILRKDFSDRGFEFSEEILFQLLNVFDLSKIDQLYYQVGEGLRSSMSIMDLIFASASTDEEERSNSVQRQESSNRNTIPLRGLTEGVMVHYSTCCHPLPGDRIVGIQTPGKGVAVHTIDCITLESFYDMPERWMDVSWDIPSQENQLHVGRLSIKVVNKPGSLAELASCVANKEGNIANLKILGRRPEFFDMSLDIEVRNTKHLNSILSALRKLSVVNKIERAES